jgi:serine/threonine protein phosphatase PrpC
MSVSKDLAYFNLNRLDGRLGCEKSRTKTPSNDAMEIRIVVKPFVDLTIADEVEVVLRVPLEYHVTGGIKVSVPNADVVRFIQQMEMQSPDRICIDDAGNWVLPGMEKAKYLLPVWFYAIRHFFKRPNMSEWKTAVLLDARFKQVDREWPIQPSMHRDVILFCGSGRTRGKRNYMEDVDFATDDIIIGGNGVGGGGGSGRGSGGSMGSIAVFGVLDGHGGEKCAQLCKENIPSRIAAHMRSGLPCPDALHRSFCEADKQFLESPSGSSSGSTANVAVYDRDRNVFYVANTGDTRAVVCRNGTALDLSYDRKGSDSEEIARVVRAGGFVANGRIQGSLAVSRALGDIQLKEQGNLNLKGVLLPDPELSCFFPTAVDHFMIIATDGLWDVLSSQAAVDHVRNLLKTEGLDEDLSGLGADIVSVRLSQVAHNLAVHAVSNLNRYVI